MEPLNSIHSLSVATVGTKGQIVIPLEVREALNINPGDKVVLLARGKKAVVVPMNGMQAWLDKLSVDFDHLRNVVNESTNTKE